MRRTRISGPVLGPKGSHRGRSRSPRSRLSYGLRAAETNVESTSLSDTREEDRCLACPSDGGRRMVGRPVVARPRIAGRPVAGQPPIVSGRNMAATAASLLAV